MGKAKEIVLRPITAQEANALIRRVHYSGKVVNNSQLHIGAFYRGKLEGAMQFGPSLDKRKIMGLVDGTGWNEFIELNRLAFTDALPRNSESRALAIAMKLLRKHAPQIKWVVSFADATQCGDGTIYRASGFVLTGMSVSENLCRLNSGQVFHKMSLETGSNGKTKYKKYPEFGDKSYWELTDGTYNFRKFAERIGAEVIPGYQLRYIYFIDPSCRERLTVPEIPYERIWEVGAGMYLGEKYDEQRAGEATQ